jgi:hypothetical protein
MEKTMPILFACPIKPLLEIGLSQYVTHLQQCMTRNAGRKQPRDEQFLVHSKQTGIRLEIKMSRQNCGVEV